jgi:hypothetical protein
MEEVDVGKEIQREKDEADNKKRRFEEIRAQLGPSLPSGDVPLLNFFLC